MRLIAIDPGFSRTGQGSACAYFEEGMLLCVWFARPITAWPRHPVDEVIWEMPQVDTRTYHSTPDVIELAAVGGELAGIYAGHGGATISRVTPSQWKGSTPKPVAHSRLWEGLNVHEKDLLGGHVTLQQIEKARKKGALQRWKKPGGAYYPKSFDTHNLLDAVAIGRWRLDAYHE
jgi:hypothetical protein